MGRVAATKKKSKRFDGYADARRRRRRRGAIATANENDRKRMWRRRLARANDTEQSD